MSQIHRLHIDPLDIAGPFEVIDQLKRLLSPSGNTVRRTAQPALLSIRLVPQVDSETNADRSGTRHARLCGGRSLQIYDVYESENTTSTTLVAPNSHSIHVQNATQGTHIILAATTVESAVTASLEITYEVIARTTESAGGIVAHASAVATRHGSLLLLGGSGAGKTAIALALASRLHGSLISGDRVLIYRDGNLAGLPLPVRVHPDTVTIVPELRRLAHLPFTFGKYELTATAFSELTGIRTGGSGPLRACLVLERKRTGPVEHRPIPKPTAAVELASEARRHADDQFSTNWLRIGNVPASTPHDVGRRWLRLGTRISVHCIRWSGLRDLDQVVTAATAAARAAGIH